MEIGAVLDGKVTGITKFGAFVALPEGKSGLVHISEVANTYVTDVSAFLQVGQSVRVRVMSVSPDGKINLSIKRADGGERTQSRPRRAEREDRPPVRESAPEVRKAESEQGAAAPAAESSDFEDRLRRFMKESDSRIADNRLYADRPRKSNRRK